VGNHSQGGGAIYASSGLVYIVNSSFAENYITNGSGGGAISGGSADITVFGSLFTGNYASASGDGYLGGAIGLSGGGGTLVNNTFFGNYTLNGLSGGSTDSNGSAVFLDTGSLTSVSNSIFWGDTGPDVFVSAGAVLQLTSNTFSVATACGSGFTCDPLDPVFADQPNGDYTPTEAACLNTADRGSVPSDVADVDGDGNVAEPVPLDLAGQPRLTGVGLDLGAFEAQSAR
jgi:hypothetical protein